MLRATVSGSFHRHLIAVYEAVGELREIGVDVLSPSDPRVVDHIREFLFVASDRTRLKRQVQQRHFDAIAASDFLWLVCPDGYVGVSASMEIGWAMKAGTPVFATKAPTDVTAEDFVTVVPSIRSAVEFVSVHRISHEMAGTMLTDPDIAAQKVITATEATQSILMGRTKMRPADATRAIRQSAQLVGRAFQTLSR